MNKTITVLTVLAVMLSVVAAVAWSPQGNVDLKNYYNITNLSHIGSFNLSGPINGTSWNISAQWLRGLLNYTNLTSMPSPCSTGFAITNLSYPTTCTRFLLGTGDTATGNYTFNTNTLFIDSTNNKVGIGTTGPNVTFHVVGDPDVAQFQRSGINGLLRFSQSSTDWVISTTDNNLNIKLLPDGTGYVWTPAKTGINTTLPNATLNIFNSLGNTSFLINNATNPHLFVNGSTGLVGIGTTTPQNAFNVIGNINSTGAFINNANSGTTANISVGSCWIAFSGGIHYATNCSTF